MDKKDYTHPPQKKKKKKTKPNKPGRSCRKGGTWLDCE